jgi:acetyl esterase/lipase
MGSPISENDQKVLARFAAMMQAAQKENATHPRDPETQLRDYRATMLKINPFKFPPGFKSKPVASFEPARELRPGMTASVSIPNGRGPFPILIHGHGHGLRAGRPPEYEPWIREMSSYGFVVIFPDYRWQPDVTYQDQIDDMLFSIKWTQDNAAKINGDVQRLVLGGDSAAGALAFDVLLRTLADPNGPRFKAFTSVDGTITMASQGDGRNLIADLKPELPLPPIYMVVGSADRLASHSIAAAQKFLEIRKDYELAIFYGMPHDFAKFPELDAMKEANRHMMEFLKKAVA